jgi:hypothetical protein
MNYSRNPFIITWKKKNDGKSSEHEVQKDSIYYF